jgi:hypothetical protein
MLLVKLSAMAEARSAFIFIVLLSFYYFVLNLRWSATAQTFRRSGSVAGLNTLTSSVTRRLG